MSYFFGFIVWISLFFWVTTVDAIIKQYIIYCISFVSFHLEEDKKKGESLGNHMWLFLACLPLLLFIILYCDA